MKNSKTIRFILWNVSVLIEMWNENGLFNVHIKSIYICTFNSYQLTDHLSCIYDRDIHKIQHNTERGTKKKDKKNYNKLWIAFSILYTHRHTKTLSIPIRTNEKKNIELRSMDCVSAPTTSASVTTVYHLGHYVATSFSASLILIG